MDFSRAKLRPGVYEKQLLDQRGLIETEFGCLKHKFHVCHTRHRSVTNAMTHLMATLAAYTIGPLKLMAIKRIKSDRNLLKAIK